MPRERVYTKKGDDGTTGLFYGGRVRKDSELPRAYGAVDEAQAVLGLARSTAGPGELDSMLVSIMRDLWVLMAELATLPENRSKLTPGASAVTQEMIDRLESTIDGLDERFDPPTEFVSLLAEMAADARPESLRVQLVLMAEADQRELLPHVAVPTLLIWGELDVRSPLGVARQFERAIPQAELVVIPDVGHVSNLEAPGRFNEAVRAFCRVHSELDGIHGDPDCRPG